MKAESSKSASTSDQLYRSCVSSLQTVRAATQHAQGRYGCETIELHPNLLPHKASDVAKDIEEAFNPAPRASTSTLASFSLASTSIYPPVQERGSKHRIILIPSAQLLRSTHNTLLWSQLLDPPDGYSTILISALPLDRWRTAEGLEDGSGYKPIVRLSHNSTRTGEQSSSNSATEALANSLPSAQDLHARYGVSSSVADSMTTHCRSRFVVWASAALGHELAAWDMEEMLFVATPVWVAACLVVESQAPSNTALTERIQSLRHGPALFAIAGPILRSAMKDIHTRSVGVSSWLKSQKQQGAATTARADGELYSEETRDSTRVLPTLAALLLLSAFLASHLPARADARYFLRDEAVLSGLGARARKRRRRIKGRGLDGASTHDRMDDGDGGDDSNSHPLLLGPKPFPLQRMLYIFQNLCVEFQVDVAAATSAAQRSWQKKRRKQAGWQPTSESDGMASSEADDSGLKDIEAADDFALHNVVLTRVLQELVAARMVVQVSPPSSTILATERVGNATEGDQYLLSHILPTIPVRLEAMNQVTMRCNCLRDEMKTLIVGDASEKGRRAWWTRLEEVGL
ncbi:unnamed protein product [Jaminaea pallidilutea]